MSQPMHSKPYVQDCVMTNDGARSVAQCLEVGRFTSIQYDNSECGVRARG